MKKESDNTQERPFNGASTYGKLGIIPLMSTKEIGAKVDAFLVDWRKERVESGIVENTNDYSLDSFIVEASTPRFGSGEGKGTIKQSVRGKDLYILVDVCNYSLTYTMAGFENAMSPDDHYQDLKRVIAAACGKAHRINVIMPYLYEGRQQLRSGRESLDSAHVLQELTKLGVENIITFDAHEPRVMNSIPLAGFESMSPAYQFIKNILRKFDDLQLDNEHLMAISPDSGGMRRAIYLANVLGINMGMFYKRRDYTTVINGQNPVIAHEFLGTDVDGKDIIIIDDMISSGDKVIETAQLLKRKKARRIFICATFGIFTGGVGKFDTAYKNGVFDLLVTTNLVYQPDELRDRPYYVCCDMSKYLALIIDTLNHDASLSALLDPVDRIHKVVRKYQAGETI
ncbi:MAG: ribose-phosphate pyrophosphokinase [Lachnospiraceae bacterium]|nr:ribose-phosphate pyrophosphokinase [Lachnospiraceae bacterium]